MTLQNSAFFGAHAPGRPVGTSHGCKLSNAFPYQTNTSLPSSHVPWAAFDRTFHFKVCLDLDSGSKRRARKTGRRGGMRSSGEYLEMVYVRGSDARKEIGPVAIHLSAAHWSMRCHYSTEINQPAVVNYAAISKRYVTSAFLVPAQLKACVADLNRLRMKKRCRRGAMDKEDGDICHHPKTLIVTKIQLVINNRDNTRRNGFGLNRTMPHHKPCCNTEADVYYAR